MRQRVLLFGCGLVTALLFGQPWSAQSPRIRATMTGEPGDGKCTYEVVVDGAADVEIHGDQGDLRTTSGRPAQWRRLTCNQPLPNNPVNFQFRGVDGRGSQRLLRDPNSSGGVAVIRIGDPQGGSETYAGELFWRGGVNHYGGVGSWGGGHNQGGEWGRGQRINIADAMNICRNQVVAVRNVPLNSVRVTPSTQEADGDMVVKFSYVTAYGSRAKAGTCSVSRFGQITDFQVEQNPPYGRTSWNQALNTCQREVAQSLAVSEENVRVQHGIDPGNGSFLINYQAQDRVGRIRTGVCRVSPTGEVEELRRWGGR